MAVLQRSAIFDLVFLQLFYKLYSDENIEGGFTVKKSIILVVLFCLVMCFVPACGTSVEEKNADTYEEAVGLLEKGKYDEGKELLETIREYKDVSAILEQIRWESRAYACIEDLRMALKNPDSLQIKDIAFFSGDTKKELTGNDLAEAQKMSEIFCPKGEPVIVFNTSGENELGGSGIGFHAFMYGDDGYEYLGACASLIPDECSGKEKTVSNIINDCSKYLTVVGEKDINRIGVVVKDHAYTSIQIIE